jgi:hypothetical protein
MYLVQMLLLVLGASTDWYVVVVFKVSQQIYLHLDFVNHLLTCFSVTGARERISTVGGTH